MRALVTGSSGHLGEAMVRTLRVQGADVVGLDSRPSPWTDVVGSVNDPDLVREAMAGVEVVFHMAALHKPQLAFLPAASVRGHQRQRDAHDAGSRRGSQRPLVRNDFFNNRFR